MADVMKSPRRLGWVPELPDPRDYAYADTLMRGAALVDPAENIPMRLTIPKVDKYMPHVDQGNLGSCTGASSNYMFQYERRVVTRSILQIYWNARLRIGMTMADSGAYIRDAVLSLREEGAGRASYWPYDESKFTVDPPLKVDKDALARRIFTAYALENLDNSGKEYRHCLAEGHPFVIGFTVFSELMSDRTAIFGILPMPDFKHEYAEGGHAVCVIGYDLDFRSSLWASNAMALGFPAYSIPMRAYIVRNSWGDAWGIGGDFAVDMDYFDKLDLADDAWTTRNYTPPKSGIVA